MCSLFGEVVLARGIYMSVMQDNFDSMEPKSLSSGMPNLPLSNVRNDGNDSR